MKEGGENVTGHNFREELYLFYTRDRGRMIKFNGVRLECSARYAFKAKTAFDFLVQIFIPAALIIPAVNAMSL